MTLKTRTNDEVWVDKYGNRIPISSMSEEYAKNCLRLLLRKQRQELEAEVYKRLRKEVNKHFYQGLLPSYTKGVI